MASETYPLLVVTEFPDGEAPLICTVYYGQTNAHWYMATDEVVLPELPSACILIISGEAFP